MIDFILGSLLFFAALMLAWYCVIKPILTAFSDFSIWFEDFFFWWRVDNGIQVGNWRNMSVEKRPENFPHIGGNDYE